MRTGLKHSKIYTKHKDQKLTITFCGPISICMNGYFCLFTMNRHQQTICQQQHVLNSDRYITHNIFHTWSHFKSELVTTQWHKMYMMTSYATLVTSGGMGHPVLGTWMMSEGKRPRHRPVVNASIGDPWSSALPLHPRHRPVVNAWPSDLWSSALPLHLENDPVIYGLVFYLYISRIGHNNNHASIPKHEYQ